MGNLQYIASILVLIILNVVSFIFLVWHKGLSCLAPYSGDNEYYEAVINSIQATSEGHREAVVTFIGYG